MRELAIDPVGVWSWKAGCRRSVTLSRMMGAGCQTSSVLAAKLTSPIANRQGRPAPVRQRLMADASFPRRHSLSTSQVVIS